MSTKAILNGAKVYSAVYQNVYSKGFNLHPSLKKLCIPTLIIHGDNDPIPFCTAESIHASIPQSKFVLMEECGHFPYVEKPDSFFDHVLKFLE